MMTSTPRAGHGRDFLDLPENLLLRILGKLPASALASCGRASRRWLRAVSDPSLPGYQDKVVDLLCQDAERPYRTLTRLGTSFFLAALARAPKVALGEYADGDAREPAGSLGSVETAAAAQLLGLLGAVAPRMRELVVAWQAQTFVASRLLSSMVFPTQLSVLTLTGTHLCAADAVAVMVAPCMGRLLSLRLLENYRLDLFALKVGLMREPHLQVSQLTHLDLSGSRCTDAFVDIAQALTRLSALQTLQIDYYGNHPRNHEEWGPLTPSRLAEVAAMPAAAPPHLALDAFGFDARLIGNMLSLVAVQQLRALTLTKSMMDDSAGAALRAQQGLSRLTMLNIAGHRLTTAGLAALVSTPHFQSLQELNVSTDFDAFHAEREPLNFLRGGMKGLPQLCHLTAGAAGVYSLAPLTRWAAPARLTYLALVLGGPGAMDLSPLAASSAVFRLGVLTLQLDGFEGTPRADLAQSLAGCAALGPRLHLVDGERAYWSDTERRAVTSAPRDRSQIVASAPPGLPI